MKIVKLNLFERSMIYSLNIKSNFATLKAITSLKEKMLPTEAENKKWNIVVDEMGMKWDRVDTEIEVEIEDAAFLGIKSKLRDMDDKHELTPEFISLYEKFCL